MLDSCILGMNYGSSYGSGALKALQNDSIPEIELLVREAIQNSSDASLGLEEKSFGVNFNFHEFCPQKLNSVFEGISDILDGRYPEDSADYLEIRDYKTSGLTGKVRKKDISQNDHGNYFKLVFDTGKEQTNSDGGKAGGSWGYGKSVYFRVGMGLVIFYSHVKENEAYESRLIAALVERESSSEAILTKIKEDSIGRAWWGRWEDKANKSELLPITDEMEIQEILDIFGIEKFDEDETGTSIIIPYIDKEKLMAGIFPEHCGINDDIISMCTFKDDIVEYTKLAVQKWYAPKIFNKNLSAYSDQKWLAVRVNDEPIRFQDMRPFFQLVQELYTAALSANKYGKQIYVSQKFPGIRSVEVFSTKVAGQKSGNVATVIVNGNDLGGGMTVIPPKAYLRLFNGVSDNDPIVMYARAAGMVLDYKVDGKWAKGITKPEETNDYMLSFYVPNCDVLLKQDSALGEYAGVKLGEYLRKCEKSDHMDWNDESTLTIVTNLAKQVTTKINQCYKKTDFSEMSGAASRLSGRLGRRLLPTLNFGKKKGGTGGGSEGGGGAVKNLEVSFTPAKYENNTMSMNFLVKFKNIKKDAFIGVFVESAVGLMDARSWENDIKTAFPITVPILCNCCVYAVNSSQTSTFDSSCSPDCRIIENDFSTIETVYTEAGSVLGIRINNKITNAIVSGTIVLASSDKKYCCTLKESKE